MALRVLTVDLPDGEVREELPVQIERDYLGGRGAIAWLLLNRLPSDTAPLSPANLLIFAAGPLSGSAAFATGGFIVGTRSPLTGSIGYGWAQGHWGAALRQSGIDVLVIRGQAPEWSYLQISPAGVQLRSAAHLLGLDTRASAAALAEELGPSYRALCLGPAGEAEVAYAAIVAEGRYMAEPAGAGAVMAHKRLKAIVAQAAGTLVVPDANKLNVATTIIRRRVDGSALAASIRQFGSSYLLNRAATWGGLSEHDGRSGQISESLLHIPSALALRGHKEDRGCEGCPMPCYFDYVRPGGERVPRPELEIVAGFARCGISNPDALMQIADLCLGLGIDPASASAAIAFLMECQEEGLAQSQTLPYGNAEAIFAALEGLGVRRERRDVLSLGVGEMHEIFWGGIAFAPQVKGLAMPGLDPRGLTGIALAMASAPIGGDYRYAMNYDELVEHPPAWVPEETVSPHEPKGKVLRLIWHERLAAVLDAAGICRRLGLMAYQISPGEMLAMIVAATGVSYSGADLARLGERIVTVERLFARRHCDNGGVDELPKRYRAVALEEGNAAGKLPPLSELLAEYYRRHGWTAQGDPTPERLKELGIEA